ncbi:MAG: cellulase family glycosylhydrolase [Armatimonadetes bacterium]|nr:cellulase family glycosylhydrolase [Armatimonadota bacterium]
MMCHPKGYGLWAALGVLFCVNGLHDAEAAPSGKFVTSKGAKLFLDGREYRAVGVNIPHLHQAYAGTWFHIPEIYGTSEKAKAAVIEALDDAQKSGVAFIRFFANPGYPRDTDLLYARNPQRYWRLMDDLFSECRQRRLKLIPSLQTLLGWYLYCGETAQAVLNPNSKTYRATHQYIREFVTRYRDDPTVLMWELANEGMLAADVDMAGTDLLPAGVYPPGAVVRAKGVREDSLTWEMILRLYREHMAFIKILDPNHPVTSGDAFVRPECASRRETFPDFKYRNDTLREWLSNNLASQPEPLDVFSFHTYGSFELCEPASLWGLSALELLRSQARAVHAARVPLFIGELGQMKPSFREDRAARWSRAAIDLLEKEGVSLAALWVWHFPWQPDLTVSSATHPLLTRRIAAFNRKYAQAQK